jgi:nucleoside-diphosphate kinase
MTSNPIVAIAVEGNNAIELVRLINGATKPMESAPGSIRGDFSIDITHNVVHASDSPENAERELRILFDEGEILEYRRIDEAIIYGPDL